MLTRRTFLTGTAIGIAKPGYAVPRKEARRSPVPEMTKRVRSMGLLDDTIMRHSSMNGDNWHMSWGSDDRQYASMCDGYGAARWPRGIYNSRLVAIDGEASNATFHEVLGYPDLIPTSFAKEPRYYNFGVIALDGKIYQLLGTWPVPLTKGVSGLRFTGVKLIYSLDDGRTWRNQDGSSPVRWEDWGDRERGRNMLFYDEPQEAFSLPVILQMGKGYSSNRDGYVYIYSPNGNTEGTMNELVMLRVPKAQILSRGAYEYFAGRESSGAARWSSAIDARIAVHTFPSGWVNKNLHPWAWVPSITYNEPLNIYMMANWATAPGRAPDLEWFTKPSYLGFWVASQPWGPWTQVYESTSWTPGRDVAARCYSPIIAPKWIAPDGKSFWLVWTDFQQKLNRRELARRQKSMDGMHETERLRAAAELDRLNRPYYSFNIQRVNIGLG